MNWYIGQRIVAVKDHSVGRFKKGDEFNIKGIMQSPCKCGGVLFDVGINSLGKLCHCPDCNIDWDSHNINWFHESMFHPIDELSDYTTESLIEEIEITNPVNIPEYDKQL